MGDPFFREPAPLVQPEGVEFLLHLALWEPEIPPNTGNVARLCAATGVVLHLVGRLGFRLDDRSLKRAGLDYWEFVDLRTHATFADLEAIVGIDRIYCVEVPASRNYTQVAFRAGDCLIFGSESKGLPPEIRERYAARTIGIPMPTGKVRSLNLATSAGIVVYEAMRQLHGW